MKQNIFNFWVLGVFCSCLFFTHCDNSNKTKHPKSNEKNRNMVPYDIRIKLIDYQNNPVSDALVCVTGGPDAFPEIAVLSDNNGYFKLTTGKIAGTYTITVQFQGKKNNFKVEVPQKESLNTLVLGP